MNNKEKGSNYLEYLPAIYQMEGVDATANFLGRFLKAFEKVLAGIPDENTEPKKGIDEILDKIHDYFDPHKTPAKFLQWLAGWMALTLKEGEEWYGEEDAKEKSNIVSQVVPLNEERNTPNRNLISRIVQLYYKRGTLEGLLEYLKIYVGEEIEITINEFLEPFQIGVTSTVGVNTVVGEGRPYYFQVHMVLPVPDFDLLIKKRHALIEIINREKPAHTYYGLTIEVPTMQIGVYSTVGSDTLLGGIIYIMK